MKLTDAVPRSLRVVVPARLSMTRIDDSLSPYFGLNPPAVSSKFCTVSGLNALVRPNRRNGSWISTPSMIVRFWSGPPPRTEIRLSKSAVALTPGSVCRTLKMFSPAPATVRTWSGLSSMVAGARAACTAAPLTVTSSVNCAELRSVTSSVTGAAPIVTVTSSVMYLRAETDSLASPGGSASANRPEASVTARRSPDCTTASRIGCIEKASSTRPLSEGCGAGCAAGAGLAGCVVGGF